MKIIIGLGNPGEEYKETRHNAGFIILDEIKTKLEFPDFKFNKKFNALLSEKNIAQEKTKLGFLDKFFSSNKQKKIILVKPQTFMNLSGKTVRAILDFYKIAINDLIIINDDLDIIVGKYKLSSDSSSRGHNGVQSIIDNLGTQDFRRLKIGVEKNEGRASRQTPGEKFVLEKFSPDELSKVISLTNNILTEIL
ncbi:MAG: aminoacyl-tRNA hydrolase [Parcubacteria group bacterium]|jgi:PTH1 family peptidyl-tRNA hydrolase